MIEDNLILDKWRFTSRHRSSSSSSSSRHPHLILIMRYVNVSLLQLLLMVSSINSETDPTTVVIGEYLILNSASTVHFHTLHWWRSKQVNARDIAQSRRTTRRRLHLTVSFGSCLLFRYSLQYLNLLSRHTFTFHRELVCLAAVRSRLMRVLLHHTLQLGLLFLQRSRGALFIDHSSYDHLHFIWESATAVAGDVL